MVKAVTPRRGQQRNLGGASPHQQVGRCPPALHLTKNAGDAARAFCRSCRPITLKIRRWWPAAMRPIAKTRRSTRWCRSSRRGPTTSKTSSKIVDDGRFLEVSPSTRRTWSSVLRAWTDAVGIVANQPAVPGVLDIDVSVKAARLCGSVTAQHPAADAGRRARLPPPGKDQEHGGIIRHGAVAVRLVEATVPKVTLITRKAAGAPIRRQRRPARARRHQPGYPTAEIAVMGTGRRGQHHLPRADPRRPPRTPPTQGSRDGSCAVCRRVSREVRQPYTAASLGYVDEVIRPRETRKRSSPRCMLRNKRQQNPPKSTETSRCKCRRLQFRRHRGFRTR